MGVFVQSGIFNRHARGRGKRHSQVLVLGREVFSTFLFREVKIPEDGVADPDGYPEERFHRRMMCGKSVGFGMLPQVMQAQGCRPGDQEPQYAVAGGKWTNALGEFLVDTDGDEVAEGAVLADDAQRSVAGMKQVARRIHHAFQDRFQAQFSGNGHHGFEQAPYPFFGHEQFVRPGHEGPQECLKGNGGRRWFVR